MRRILFAFLMVMVMAAPLTAQMPRSRVYVTNDPSTWMSAGAGIFRANVVNDGVTGSSWDFGNSYNPQYRVTLESGLANGSSIGIAGGFAHAPFVYSADLARPLPADASGIRCANCNAHLDMMTLVGSFHSGAGLGLHQVLELSGGVVAYRNLKQDSDGAKLAPGGGNIDPLFSLGYGFGYGFSSRTSLDFTYDYLTYAIHERTGLSNGTSNTNSMPAMRVSLRMGFGGRSTRR